jgi:hypothetical protein
MSTLIGEARARLLGYADRSDEIDALSASGTTQVLPPMDEVQIRVELDAYADPFAPGNEGGFDLVWDYPEPPTVSEGIIEPVRSKAGSGPSRESSRAVGRLWSNFATSDAALAVLGQLAG